MLKKIGVLLTLIVFLCAGTALAAPKSGGTLIWGRGGDSVGLDPAYETDGNSFQVCDNIYEALVFYKDESTDLEPGSGRILDDLTGRQDLHLQTAQGCQVS